MNCHGVLRRISQLKTKPFELIVQVGGGRSIKYKVADGEEA